MEPLSRPPLPEPEATGLRQWLFLAVAVLATAGAFALLLVFARMPPFDRLVTDPAFFRRALVIHVDLALVFWFVAFVAGLLFLLPGRAAPWTFAGVRVSAVGIALCAVAAAIPGAEPVLANYVPMIDHPLYTAGMLTFGAGVLVAFADRRLLAEAPPRYPVDGAVLAGLRAAGVGLVLVALTAFGSALGRPVGELDAFGFWELVNWGPGHVLQLVTETAMVAVWLLLLGSATGRPVVARGPAAVLFALLVLPWMASPLLTLEGTQSGHYRAGFTALMRWGLFPVVTVFAVLCVRALVRAWRAGELGARPLADLRVSGFLVSLGLTALGFVLGALIDGSNTIVPAHYHAAIGAVTAAFMASTHLLLDWVGVPQASPRLRRLASWQPAVYGLGQMVFALGFALAGAHGQARKVYGAEQTRGLVETVGLGVMGVGGLVAVAGGLLFLAVVLGRRLRAPALAPTSHPSPWRFVWTRNPRHPSTHSNG